VARAVTAPAPWPATTSLSELRRARRRLRYAAQADVRAQVARILGLEAVEAIEVDITVEPWLDGARVRGTLTAKVTRICGVSLEPFDEEIAETIDLRLVPAGSPNAPRAEGALVIDLGAEDPPEAVENDVVDLAALFTEHLALGLSPFPRKPGAVFEPPAGTAETSPFAALAQLKGGDGA
jgi:uncharacterized metal-binding protein YceD (DUF177 family)